MKPKLTVLIPTSNVFLASFDSLDFKVRLEDDNGLEQFQFQVIDEDLSPIGIGGSQSLNGEKQREVSGRVSFKNSLVPSGKYFLQFKAFDASNSASAFVEINYQGSPQIRESIFVLGYQGSDQKLYRNDSVTTLITSRNNIDPIQFGISTEANSCAILEGFDLGVEVYDLNGLNIKLDLNPYRQAPERSFNHLSYFQNDLWVAFDDGRISKYKSNGNLELQFTINSGFHPLWLKQIEDKLFVEMFSPVNQERKLVVYYALTGAHLQEKVLTKDLVDLFAYQTDQFLLFSNNGNNAVVEELGYPGMNLITRYTFFNDSLHFCTGDANPYVQLNSGLYRFNYSSLSASQKNSQLYSAGYSDLRAEQVWLAKDNQIEMRNQQTFALEEQVSVMAIDKITGMGAAYNY